MYRWCAFIGQSKRQCPIKYTVLFVIDFTLSITDRNQPIIRKFTISDYNEKQTDLKKRQSMAACSLLRPLLLRIPYFITLGPKM